MVVRGNWIGVRGKWIGVKGNWMGVRAGTDGRYRGGRAESEPELFG